MEMPEDQYALYAEFGMTAEKAQVLEVEAGNVALYFVAILVDPNEITPDVTEMFRGIEEDVNRKTLGALLKHLKKYLNIDDRIANIVDDSLKQRNYLTHHFFRTHNFGLFSEEGRRLMMAELKEIQVSLDKAFATLSAMTQILKQISARENISNERVLHFQQMGIRVKI
jgi:hypothetical protein